MKNYITICSSGFNRRTCCYFIKCSVHSLYIQSWCFSRFDRITNFFSFSWAVSLGWTSLTFSNSLCELCFSSIGAESVMAVLAAWLVSEEVSFLKETKFENFATKRPVKRVKLNLGEGKTRVLLFVIPLLQPNHMLYC